MFYTSKSINKININNDTVTTLTNGVFLKDYLCDSKLFRTYKFKTNFEENNKKDISIIISPESGYYSMFLYDNQSKIVFSNLSNSSNSSFINNQLTFDGYFASSFYTNQINLFKNSTYFMAKGTYYLVVYYQTNFYFDKIIDGYYNLGYKSEDSYFVLNDGLPISIYLNDNSTIESFIYYHYNTNRSLLLSVGKQYWGSLSLYYDFRDFKQKLDNASYNVTFTDNYQICPEMIKEKCKDKNICKIYLSFKTSQIWGQKFSVVAKTISKKPMLYTSGILQNQYLLIDEIHYYYLRVGKEDKGLISIGFMNGRVISFLNIIPPSKLNTSQRDWNYPTASKNVHSSNYSFLGQSIEVSSQDLKECDPQCILLVGVMGRSLGYNLNSIKYSFRYITKISPINDGEAIIGSLQETETIYYSFKANSKVENIYVSVNSNNPGGDVDMVINYGENFPTRINNDWTSNSIWAEFIDIPKDDPLFLTKGVSINNSNYTIGLTAYTNTTYTLYITTNKIKILPVGNYHSSSCTTKNDYCYFRLTQDIQISNLEDKIYASTEFIYGNGTIYAKLYDTQNLNIYKDLPTKDSYDFSSSDQNLRNFIKIDPKLFKDKLTNNNTRYTLLYSVFCDLPCFFTINSDYTYGGFDKYLSTYRENLVYVKKKSVVGCYFNYYENNNLTLQSVLLDGSGSFTLYFKQNYTSNTTLAKYSLNAVNSTDYQFISGNYYGQLYLEVQADSEDVAFIVKLSNYHNWTNIQVGKSQKFISPLYTDFLAYFYFPKAYESITINLHPKDHNTGATMSANIVIVDKTKPFKSLFIPPEDNNQFIVNTDYNLQSVLKC